MLSTYQETVMRHGKVGQLSQLSDRAWQKAQRVVVHIQGLQFAQTAESCRKSEGEAQRSQPQK